MRARVACALLAAACLAIPATLQAGETCARPPYTEASPKLAALVQRLSATLVRFPSLEAALAGQKPVLCLDDSLVEEQAYFEPKTNRIVLNSQLDPDFQLAILIHEIRHLEQYGRGVCPSTAHRLTDYIRARLALEADAAAIGVYAAWTLRQAGEPGPWDKLKSWPTHDDLVARFAAEIASGADEVRATSATFAQWFDRADRREIYTFAICSNYLDALDREKVEAGKLTLPEDFAALPCVMPDGRPYGCTVPP